jgi:hypothetical protein
MATKAITTKIMVQKGMAQKTIANPELGGFSM